MNESVSPRKWSVQILLSRLGLWHLSSVCHVTACVQFYMCKKEISRNWAIGLNQRNIALPVETRRFQGNVYKVYVYAIEACNCPFFILFLHFVQHLSDLPRQPSVTRLQSRRENELPLSSCNILQHLAIIATIVCIVSFHFLRPVLAVSSISIMGNSLSKNARTALATYAEGTECVE